jgi:hypothetical protein
VVVPHPINPDLECIHCDLCFNTSVFFKDAKVRRIIRITLVLYVLVDSAFRCA